MEFKFSLLFRRVGIDIFYFNNIRNNFNNFNNSFKFIRFNDINQILLEEFIESYIALLLKFRVFVKIFLHLNSQHMN